MSIDVSEKLKLIRESERLNRKEFSELTGVAYSSLSSYESRSKNAGVEAIMKVLQHPRFTKYTLSHTLGKTKQRRPTPVKRLVNNLS